MAATLSLLTLLPGAPASAQPAWTPSPPDLQCVDTTGTIVTSNGMARGCVDLSKADPFYWERLGNTGFGWIDLGFAERPAPNECQEGRVTREDGWAWRCVVKDGKHLVVKTNPWRRPPQFAYSHTAARSRSTVTLTANTTLNGCRLTASDKRILAGQDAALTGRSARRTLDTSTVPAGRYVLRVTCQDARINTSSDLLVRTGGSTVLRSDCLDAWHDGKYGDVVPGYGRRMTPAVASATTVACVRLTALTYDEFQRVGQEAYLRIGQIAERQVRRVSAEKGIPICEAMVDVFRPVDTVGRPVEPWPQPYLEVPIPIAGYQPDGYFPILFRQWQDGPVRMDMLADCTSDVQAMRLVAGTWARCGIDRLALHPAEPHQMFPVYAFDRSGCPTSYPVNEVQQGVVCIVWGDRIGNHTVGGAGRVFTAKASLITPGGPVPNGTIPGEIYDCQARALRAGQYQNIDVDIMPTLT